MIEEHQRYEWEEWLTLMLSCCVICSLQICLVLYYVTSFLSNSFQPVAAVSLYFNVP